MELIHFTNGINPLVIDKSVNLAVSEAPAMVTYVVDTDSPILPLAQAEVAALLHDAMTMVGAGARQRVEGLLCELKVGVIVAIDDEQDDPRFAGFIQYKPRLLADGVATIGYAAVEKSYRGQGVFRLMLDELKRDYPVLGLDCPLDLVPMYEHLGFHPTAVQGAHVGMSTGTMSGKNWGHGQEFLDQHPSYIRAKEAIRAKLGKATRDVYAKRDADTRKRVEEVKALLQAREAAAQA